VLCHGVWEGCSLQAEEEHLDELPVMPLFQWLEPTVLMFIITARGTAWTSAWCGAVDSENHSTAGSMRSWCYLLHCRVEEGQVYQGDEPLRDPESLQGHVQIQALCNLRLCSGTGPTGRVPTHVLEEGSAPPWVT